MAILRGPIEVTTESEAPYLEQDGLILNRNIVRKEFGGALSGTSQARGNPWSSRLHVVQEELRLALVVAVRSTAPLEEDNRDEYLPVSVPTSVG